MPSARFITNLTGSFNTAFDATVSASRSAYKRSGFLTSIGRSTDRLKSSSLLNSVLSKGNKNTSVLKNMSPPEDAGDLMTTLQRKADDIVDDVGSSVDNDALKRLKTIKTDVDAVDYKRLNNASNASRSSDIPLDTGRTSSGIGDTLYKGLETLKKYDGTIQAGIMGSYFMSLHVKGEAPWSDRSGRSEEQAWDDPAQVLELGDLMEIDPNLWGVTMEGLSTTQGTNEKWVGVILLLFIVGFLSTFFRKKKSPLYS